MAWRVVNHKDGSVTVESSNSIDKQVLFGIASDRLATEAARYGRSKGLGLGDRTLWHWEFLARQKCDLVDDLDDFYLKIKDTPKLERASARSLLKKLGCNRE